MSSIYLKWPSNFVAGAKIIANINYTKLFVKNIGWFSHKKSFFISKYEAQIKEEKTWNAAVRDWLIARPRLLSMFVSDINTKICLFGTKYQKDGREFIEYIYYKDGSWVTDIHFLDQPFSADFVIPYFAN